MAEPTSKPISKRQNKSKEAPKKRAKRKLTQHDSNRTFTNKTDPFDLPPKSTNYNIQTVTDLQGAEDRLSFFKSKFELLN